MDIAKAIILAGDCQGTEPWPSLRLAARQLVPIANRPVLFHHLDALAGAGVRHALLVTDSLTGPALRAAVGSGDAWGMVVSHTTADGVDDSLARALATDFGEPGPTHVHHADVLLRECLSSLGHRFLDAGLDALVVRPQSPAPSADDGAAGYILGIAAQERLRGAAPRDVLARLGTARARVDVRSVRASLPCRGSAETLIDANRDMLDELVPGPQGERVFGSTLQGRVALHPTAEVCNSVVRGPVTIGPNVRITDSYVGPYTSIGADVRLDCVEIEHSIVMHGARIRFLATRIEGSLVGPGAHLERDLGVPRAIRVSIGEGAEVAL